MELFYSSFVAFDFSIGSLDLLLKALEIRKTKLGINNRLTSDTFYDIARFYEAKAIYETALEYSFCAYNIRRKTVDKYSINISLDQLKRIYSKISVLKMSLEQWLDLRLSILSDR